MKKKITIKVFITESMKDTLRAEGFAIHPQKHRTDDVEKAELNLIYLKSTEDARRVLDLLEQE